MSGRLRPPWAYQGRGSFIPWIEGIARQIGDPVQRLRFLRVVVPGVPARVSNPRSLRLIMFTSAIAALLFLSLAAGAIFLSVAKTPAPAVKVPVTRPH